MQSEGIFHLIQSMSKAEKRFFTLFAEMSGGKQSQRYQFLFACLEGMKEDDPAELARLVEGSAVSDNLSVYRNRLQSLVLRSLRTLYAGRWAGSEVRQLLEEIELLFERRLYDLCGKRLEKALELARQHQLESMLLEISTWHRKLNSQTALAQQDAQLVAIREEEAGCLRRLALERDAAHAHERMRVKAKLRLITRDMGEKAEYLQEFSTEPTNFITKVHALSAQGIVEVHQSDFVAADQTYSRIKDLWEQEQTRIFDYPDLYLQTINNHLNVLLIGDAQHQRFLDEVKKLRSLTELPRHTRVNFQWVSFHQQLIFSMNFSGYEATSRLVKEIEDWINANLQEILVPQLLAFFFNITMFFFVNGEYSRANRWLTRILNQPGQAERRDIRSFARLLQVLIQYELKNIDLNEYLVRSAYRYLSRKDELYTFEIAIFDLIRKCSILPDESARQPAYAEFREALQDFHAKKKGYLGLGELLLWVESKIGGITPRTLFEQKLAENQQAAHKP